MRPFLLFRCKPLEVPGPAARLRLPPQLQPTSFEGPLRPRTWDPGRGIFGRLNGRLNADGGLRPASSDPEAFLQPTHWGRRPHRLGAAHTAVISDPSPEDPAASTPETHAIVKGAMARGPSAEPWKDARNLAGKI